MCCLRRLYFSVSMQLWFILTLWLKWGVVGCQGSKPRHMSRTGSSSEPHILAFYEKSGSMFWPNMLRVFPWNAIRMCLWFDRQTDRWKERCTEEKDEEWVGTAEKDERKKRRRRITFHSSIWQLTLWLALGPNHILLFTSDFSSHLLRCSHSSTTLISPLSSSFPLQLASLPSPSAFYFFSPFPSFHSDFYSVLIYPFYFPLGHFPPYFSLSLLLKSRGLKELKTLYCQSLSLGLQDKINSNGFT